MNGNDLSAPPGTPSGTPVIPMDGLTPGQLGREIDYMGGAPASVDMTDPAFQRPMDPLTIGDARSRTRLVYRDLPLVTIQNAWSVQAARAALYSHTIGIFELSGQLVDSVIADDRVAATLGSRVAGLFGRDVRFSTPFDSDEARACRDAWIAWWPKLFQMSEFRQAHEYSILMGFLPAQLVWNEEKKILGPRMRMWHPRYTYYHWPLRRYIALSQDGSIPIVAGNGKWVMHAPYGEYRGFIRGALRAVTEPWMLRHFAFRDMARFSEVHGIPVRIGETPAAADPVQRAQFEQQLTQLGNETTLLIPKGVDAQNSYGFNLVEAKDTAWEIFPGLIDRCDAAIVLSLLFQNLTTEVKGGAYAATTAHMDIRESGIEADNVAWRDTIYTQIARPFALFNFGDADLAPMTEWDVKSQAKYVESAKMFQQFGTAIEVLRRGGVQFKDVEELRTWAAATFGLNALPDFEITEPVAGGLGQG